MRIKTRIKLGIILSLVLAATIALLLFLSIHAMNEASRKDETAAEVVKGVAEMKIITHEYLLHPEERSLMQWRSKYDSLSKPLTGGHFKNPDEKIVTDQIFRNLERFKTVFFDLATGLRKGETTGNQESAVLRELQDRLMGELLVKSQLAVFLAFQLHQNIDAKSVKIQKRVSLLTLLLLLTLTATIIGILLWVNRSIARPIAKLEKDTRIIGSGNLDHKVGIRAKDEIGELSRAFDNMTQDLKETTTSIVELNKEIDERKAAEEALRESERFLQNVFDGIQDGISVLDRDLTIIGCNFWMEDQYAEHMPLIGKKCYKVYQGLQSPCPGCPSIPAIETGEVHSEVVPYPSAEEPSGWIELSSFPLTDRSDSVVGVIEHVKDITAKKLAEEALRESEERFRTVADFAYDWEFWIAPDGRYLYVSPSCERITGYGPEDFVNDPGLLEKIVHPDDHSTVINHLDEEQGLEKLPSFDFRIITRSGEERWINHVCQAVYGADGTYLGRRGSNRDITKQKQLQEELLKASKLESLGVLAGGIAHDFNNLMSAVVGNISLARMEMKPGSKGFKNLVEAEKASIQTKGFGDGR